MAPIFIIIGFALGYLFAKMLEPRNLCPRNWGYKLLLCIGIPCLIYGIVFLLVGINCNWWMYKVGASTATTFLGCIGLLISMLIFVKVKKNDSPQDIELDKVQETTFQSVEVENEKTEPLMDKEETTVVESVNVPTTTPHTQLELNNFLQVLFVIWMVGGGISAILQLALYFEGNYVLGGFDLALTAVGIIGIAGMEAKKRWGLIVAALFFIIQFVFCLVICQTDTTFEGEALKAFFKILILSILLMVSKDGHTAWETIWNNGVLPSNSSDSSTKDCVKEWNPLANIHAWLKKRENEKMAKRTAELKRIEKQEETNNTTTFSSDVNKEIGRLETIKSLLDRGLISEQDYIAKKKEILSNI